MELKTIVHDDDVLQACVKLDERFVFHDNRGVKYIDINKFTNKMLVESANTHRFFSMGNEGSDKLRLSELILGYKHFTLSEKSYVTKIRVPVIEVKEVEDYYLDASMSFEYIRTKYLRGGRGPKGDKELKYVPLFEMSNKWLEKCITYNANLGAFCKPPTELYHIELGYRRENNIVIND